MLTTNRFLPVLLLLACGRGPFDESSPGPDGGVSVTCKQNGKVYPVGAAVGRCLCLPDGTIGHCTGALPEDAGAGCARSTLGRLFG